jgi:hypothetical protein
MTFTVELHLTEGPKSSHSPVPIFLREIELVTAIKEDFLPDNLDRTTPQIVTNEKT